MMTDGEYNVTFIDHKNTRIRGSIVINDDGFANIFINPRLDTDKQKKTFEHEMVHLEQDDAYNQDSLQTAEARASGLAQKSEYEKRVEEYHAWLERIYSRGLDLFGLERDDPFWEKLFDVWDFRTHKDRYEGVITDGIDRYSRRQTGHMVNLIFK